MALKLKTAPATEPVTLAEAKSYLRITDTDDDALITGMIAALRHRCEAFTRRALVTQTWTLWLDQFPRTESRNAPREGYFELPVDHFDEVRRVIEIPRPPLQSVTFLQTYDATDVVTVFAVSNYLVDTASEPGRIALNQSSSWPGTLRAVNAVEIEFLAGYGTASAVPDPLKQGILMWLKLLFADKSKLFEPDESTQGLLELNRETFPPQVRALWEPYRLIKF